MKLIVIAIIAAVIGALVGSAFTFYATGSMQKTTDDLIKEFYEIENAVYVSPHSLRGKMSKGVNDFVLVDLRSQEEYEQEHIAGAVNIPAYKDRYTSAYDEKDRIVSQFRQLPDGKEIIVYCYSMPCMTGRKIGKMLAENGIYVKHLGIGWNEWRYFWNLWNHEHEWNITNVMDYISTGLEPGKPNVNGTIPPCVEGEFGC